MGRRRTSRPLHRSRTYHSGSSSRRSSPHGPPYLFSRSSHSSPLRGPGWPNPTRSQRAPFSSRNPLSHQRHAATPAARAAASQKGRRPPYYQATAGGGVRTSAPADQ